ncbi:hypothetical protein ANN_03571 [Periplaneta americana]|uniref:Uncharacterized protein n=1 Tax=Periplaneta americana TaxID=6978 RepID=A0ABQ8U4Z0_PERAM|nr:hypothetical protein ANN_03571 [Periplaneta americana]
MAGARLTFEQRKCILKWFMRFENAVEDIETFDLEDFKYNSVNITAFRLVDVEDSRVLETLEQMERFQPIGHAILNRSGIIQKRRSTFSILKRDETTFSKLHFNQLLRHETNQSDQNVSWCLRPALITRQPGQLLS